MVKKVTLMVLLAAGAGMSGVNAISVRDLLAKGEAVVDYQDWSKKGDKAWPVLNLRNKELTSLDGLENVTNIDDVKEIKLSGNNQLTLDKNVFKCASSLECLWISPRLKQVECFIKPWDYNIGWYAGHDFCLKYGLSDNKDIKVHPY